MPATAGADAEPPLAVGAGAVEELLAEDPLAVVAADDAAVDEELAMMAEDPLAVVAAGDAAVDEALEMMDEASDGETVRVLVL